MLLSFAVLLFCASSTRGNELPTEFTKCSRSDPNFNACLLKAIDDATPLLKNGIPSLNIPSIEPLNVQNVDINHGTSNPRFNLRSHFNSLDLVGLSSTKTRKVLIRFDNFKIKTESITDRLDMVGDYEMNGQVLYLPINGAGKANISMHQAISIQELKGEYYTNPSDGEIYINVTDYKIKFKPKLATFYFENLVKGDKMLGNSMNEFMNQNWKAVFSGLVPEYEKFFSSKFKEVSKNVFDNVPMKEIFLD